MKLGAGNARIIGRVVLVLNDKRSGQSWARFRDVRVGRVESVGGAGQLGKRVGGRSRIRRQEGAIGKPIFLGEVIKRSRQNRRFYGRRKNRRTVKRVVRRLRRGRRTRWGWSVAKRTESRISQN